MKKLLKGVMGITSIAVMTAGAYYLTNKLLGEPDEELDDEYEDFDFVDEEEDAEDKSREYVTLDFEEDEQEASDEEESEDEEE